MRVHFYLLSALFIFQAFSRSQAQTKRGQLDKIERIYALFNDLHTDPYTPDSTSKNLTGQLFLYQLDPYKLVFTMPEYDAILKTHNGCVSMSDLDSLVYFIEFSKVQYLKSIERLESQLSDFKIDELLVDNSDTLHFDNPYSDSYPSDLKELMDKWRIYLKIRMLGMKNFNDNEIDDDLFNKVIEMETCWLNEKKNDLHDIDFIFNLYLKSIANSYDPHSTFLTLEEVSSFNQSLSKSSMNFGFQAQRNMNGFYEILSVIPGGAAWKSGKIRMGDEIWEITDGNGLSKSVLCLDNEKVDLIFNSPEVKSISILVKHENGGTSEVRLIKEHTETSENLINIFMLEGEHNVGYLALPSFYNNGKVEEPQGSANDVAKEIMKIKSSNMDGLIMDLRDNGGGDLSEALGIVSLFLDVGPVCIMKNRNSKPILLKDLNRGAVYRGPLVILINEHSASASEMLAAALQDHNRALVVGMPSFGKATGQNIYPLDSTQLDWGFVKITTFNLFRVQGNSYQGHGVVPDVKLNNARKGFSFKETDYLNSLTPGTVNKKVYFSPLKRMPIEYLNEQFASKADDQKEMALQDYFIVNEKSMKVMYDSQDSLTNYSDGFFKVVNNRYDSNIIEALDIEKEQDSLLKRSIEQDNVLVDTYKIICDLIGKINE